MSRWAPAVLAWLAGCTPQPAAEPTPPAHRLVATDATLTVEDRGLTVHARQATLDDDGQGTAEVVRAEAPGLQITSERSQWRFADRSATFTGDVVATRRTATLTCDTLTVALGDGEQIRSATADGSVVVTQDGRRASAEHAELDGATGKIVLTGSPRLAQGGRTLAGEVITIWLDDERVDCDRCTLSFSGEAIGSGG